MAFWYFGYGSNMDPTSLRAKGVAPARSERGRLAGWRLRFNVQHFFTHEGGVGNIERTGSQDDAVLGVLHLCEDDHLAMLDLAEAYPHGYDRIEVCVHAGRDARRALTYVGTPGFRNDACLPTRRYLNILLAGASAAGLDAAYVDALRRQPVLQKAPVAPWAPPPGDHPDLDAAALARRPLCTALDHAVFDMADARWQHRFLHGHFGGKDMTLFHLKRLDSSDGSETLEDVRQRRYTPAQRACLDEFLHAYSTEYRYVGRFLYG
jgi:sulfite reductase (NADPH) flavoprotein alpha-component